MTDENSQQSSQQDQTQEEIEKLQQELQQMTEMGRRAVAEMHNLKNQFEKERSEIYKSANSSLLKSLLPVLDNLERALPHLSEENKEGIQMCLTQLREALTMAGLTETEITPEKTEFNPDLHEAFLSGPGPKNLIIEVLEKGYLVGDRVLRHAKVKVGNGEE